MASGCFTKTGIENIAERLKKLKFNERKMMEIFMGYESMLFVFVRGSMKIKKNF